MTANLFSWIATCVSAMIHPFYISMTDIKHNVKNKSLEVSVRIFSDDFEKTLRKECNCKVALIKPADKPAMDKLVTSYILKHLQIKIDGNPGQLEFAGYEQEDGSTWNYFEVKNIQRIQRLELTNSILHDNQEQVNMVRVVMNGKEKTDKLDYPKKSWTASW